jgi:hypothetical protein
MVVSCASDNSLSIYLIYLLQSTHEILNLWMGVSHRLMDRNKGQRQDVKSVWLHVARQPPGLSSSDVYYSNNNPHRLPESQSFQRSLDSG